MKTPIQKILLIDDDQDDCVIFEQVLHELNPAIVLTTLYSSEDVVEVVVSEQPDIVFLDINMPKVDGIECLRLLQKDRRTSGSPVVIYSSSDNPREIAIALRLGAVQYVQKADQYIKIKEMLQAILQAPERA